LRAEAEQCLRHSNSFPFFAAIMSGAQAVADSNPVGGRASLDLQDIDRPQSELCTI
jgi:hypothetical protein